MDLTGYIYIHAYVYIFSVAVNISDHGVLEKNPLYLLFQRVMLGSVAAGRQAWYWGGSWMLACNLIQNYEAERQLGMVWAFDVTAGKRGNVTLITFKNKRLLIRTLFESIANTLGFFFITPKTIFVCSFLSVVYIWKSHLSTHLIWLSCLKNIGTGEIGISS